MKLRGATSRGRYKHLLQRGSRLPTKPANNRCPWPVMNRRGNAKRLWSLDPSLPRSRPQEPLQDVWLERGGEEPATDPPADVDRMNNDISTIEAEILEQIKETVVRTLPPAEAGESSYPHGEVISYDDLSVEPPDTTLPRYHRI